MQGQFKLWQQSVFPPKVFSGQKALNAVENTLAIVVQKFFPRTLPLHCCKQKLCMYSTEQSIYARATCARLIQIVATICISTKRFSLAR